MDYFNNLLDKIDDIEDNFNIINSRIIEFGKSTDYKYIDFGLVNKYNKILISYLEFLKRQKEILLSSIKDESDIEYQSIKELTENRIDILIKNISEIHFKVQEISNIKKQKLDKEKVKEIFSSSMEMENLKMLLAEFENDLKIYKKLQSTLGIIIDLDDTIEKNIEKSFNNEDLILKQKEYIEDYTDALEIILKEKEKRLKAIGNRKENIFKLMIKGKIYDNTFKEIFKDKYVVGLEPFNSELNIDNKKFIKYNDNIDFLINIGNFCENYSIVFNKSKEYGLEELLLPFSKINNFLNNEISNINKVDIKKLLEIIDKKYGIGKLKNTFKYLDAIMNLFSLYEEIYSINYKRIDRYYNTGFINLFGETENLKNIITKIIKKHNIDLLIKFRRENINLNLFIENNILDIENKFLERLKNSIIFLNRKVFLIKYSTSLITFKSEIKKQLEFYKGKYLYNELILFYNKVSKNKYKMTRNEYLGNNSIGYSSGGSYSGGGGWSSGSSSGTSSYSSSGSSSW